MISRSSIKALCITDIIHIGKISTISVVYRWIVIFHFWVIATHSKEESSDRSEQLTKERGEESSA
jgi:hypothetical protein